MISLVHGEEKKSASSKPVVGYTFESLSDRTIADISGNGCNGKIQGKVYIEPGLYGNSLKFDGDRTTGVTIPDAPVLNLTQELTVSLQFCIQKYPEPAKGQVFDVWGLTYGSIEEVLKKGEGATLVSKHENWHCMVLPTGYLRVVLTGSAGQQYILLSRSPLELNRWYDVRYTYSVSQNRLSLYLDGRLEFERSDVNNTLSATHVQKVPPLRDETSFDLHMGQEGKGKSPFCGNLANVRIYDRVISDNDIILDVNQKAKTLAIWEEKLNYLAKEVPALGQHFFLLKKVEELKSNISRIRDQETLTVQEAVNTVQSIQSLQGLISSIQKSQLIHSWTPSLMCYAVNPISSILRMQDQTPPDGKLCDQLKVMATPGEYEPASFILYSLDDLGSVTIKTSDFTCKAGKIPASEIDIKVVKCWYQAATAWRFVEQDKTKKVLVPELLLNDETLVKVDEEKQTNFLKLSSADETRYVDICDPKDFQFQAWLLRMTNKDWPIQDSKTLQPVRLEKDRAKQFWITVHVPQNAVADTYAGKISLTGGGKVIGTVDLAIRVLPFRLSNPKTYYNLQEDFVPSLYVCSCWEPGSPGAITSYHRSEAQIKAEFLNLAQHNITNPTSSQAWVTDDRETLFKVLTWFHQAGLKTRPIFLEEGAANAMAGTKSDPATLKQAQARVKETLDKSEQVFGHRDVYFYGQDEASGEILKSQRLIWKAIHEVGGKIFVADNSNVFDAMGDLLNLDIYALFPDREISSKWHSKGQKIWSYAQPQGGVENPEIYRRTFGLKIYKANFDGAATYCYYSHYGNPWNDFDNSAWRDLNLVYPTVDGVIDTIAWEGYREAMDDIKYATTLKEEIQKAKQSGVKKRVALAGKAETWLEQSNVETGDLDTLRQEIIRYILELMEGSLVKK
jgi:hypothetical protein